MRKNIEWVSKSVGWGRFMMVASLGLIHKGHTETVIKIVQPYLDGSKSGGSTFHQEGGALYAIGLACARCGNNNVKFFTPYLNVENNVIVLHGACLGVGLAAMGSWRHDLVRLLMNVLKCDNAVSGEASAIGVGLVMVSSENVEIYAELKEVLLGSSHEKIQRGVSLGIAMLFALKMRNVLPFVEELMSFTVNMAARLTAVYMIALAYVGTNDKSMVKMLWEIAVNDTFDDVRRASLVALSLVMFRAPYQYLGIALLFVSNYNNFVKCGALLGMGIVFVGSGESGVVALMKSMYTDRSLLVRQTAYIASCMVLMQRNEYNCDIFKDIYCNHLSTVFGDKNTDNIAKLGAYIGFGILDAGGRNQTFSLTGTDGNVNVTAVVGVLVFQQFWYWYPLVHFVSLCFEPSSIVLVNTKLEVVPEIKLVCNSDLKLYAYPIIPVQSKREVSDKMRVSQLSHSKQSRSKTRRNITYKDFEGNPTTYRIKKSRVSSGSHGKTITYRLTKLDDIKPQRINSAAVVSKSGGANTDVETAVLETSDAVHSLINPCRVLRRQLPFMDLADESKPLETVKPITSGGIIVCFRPTDREDVLMKTVQEEEERDNKID